MTDLIDTILVRILRLPRGIGATTSTMVALTCRFGSETVRLKARVGTKAGTKAGASALLGIVLWIGAGCTLAAATLGTVGCETPKSGGGPVDTGSPRKPAPGSNSGSGAKSGGSKSSAPSSGGKASQSPKQKSSAPRSAGRGSLGVPDGSLPTPRRQDEPNAAWSIVLGTFTGPDHARAASDARDRLAARIPEFAACTTRSTPRGSMILWGQFSGPDDPAATKELKRVQTYVWQNARPFASAMLTRPEQTRKPPSSPADLRNLRAKYPKVEPLYTLQVAAWADFDGSLSLDSIRRSAEGYAAQLRAKGLDAWFHHDDDLKMSVVTIGAFGADAYDSKSTLYNPEVTALMKQFPKHLVNGEPLILKADPRNSRSPEYAQPCLLVLVPPR